MKQLAVILLSLSATSAFAATTYQCDSYDLNTGQFIDGATYSVVTDKGGGAAVYATALAPNSKPTLTYVLDAYTTDGMLFMQTSIQDLSVTFTRSWNERAGILKIQGTIPEFGSDVSLGRSFICTK